MRGIANVLLMLALLSAAVRPADGKAEAARVAPAESVALLAELLWRADQGRLHADPRWLALLHYEKAGLIRRSRSRATTPGFFLSNSGDRDPRAELHATLRAFFDPSAVVKDDEHAQCAFIARRHWITQRLGVQPDELLPTECPHYERWRAGLDASGMTLVFAEGFMSNPGSIFGHTLLRIGSTRQAESDEMLGYAVDFTANTGDDRGLEYMFKGVSGLYPAMFGVRPYYEQLKRYSDWENRDIWEYRLEVEEAELDFLLMHLWELRGIQFPYYFFTKNCSYELLRLLEIGVVDVDMSARFHGPVLPVDTVRAVVEQPGFVTGTRYRPSPETELRARLRSLSRRDRKRVAAVLGGHLDPEDVSLSEASPLARARILDVAYDQLRYEYLAGKVSEETSRGLSRRILIARSRVEGAAADEDPAPGQVETPGTRPDQGHDTSLFAIEAGWRDDESFIDIRLRPALHGLLDASGGYLQHTQIRLLDTVMRIYPQSSRVRLQELTLLEISSLTPRSRVFRPWAGAGGTGLRTRRVPNGNDLKDVSVWGTQMGVGLAWDPTPSLLLYGLGDLRLDVGPDLADNVSFGPGGRLGAFFGGAESRWKGHAFAEATYFGLGDTSVTIRGGVQGRLTTSRNTALILEATANRSYGKTWAEGSLRVDLHF
jgi:hypothetical protein